VAETLSYAQSLRVIGQALDALRINSFELQKKGAEYVVRTDSSEAAGKLSWDDSFIKNIAEKLWGRASKNLQPPLVYTSFDIDRFDREARSVRGRSNPTLVTGNVSLPLRVVGDYLDRKAAITFSISWSIHSVKVEYDTFNGTQKREDFTVQNLYDRSVHMYLRRSDRSPARA
jgi:hypothetical protein